MDLEYVYIPLQALLEWGYAYTHGISFDLAPIPSHTRYMYICTDSIPTTLSSGVLDKERALGNNIVGQYGPKWVEWN